MELPLTKCTVAAFFSISISIIAAQSVSEQFYQVYTRYSREVNELLRKLRKFGEVANCLCRCLMEKTRIFVPHEDESWENVTAFIPDKLKYTFKFPEPKRYITSRLLSCHKAMEDSEFYVALSKGIEKFFYAAVNKRTGSANVKFVINVPGLEDFDEGKLAQNPYWCRQLGSLLQNEIAFTVGTRNTQLSTNINDNSESLNDPSISYANNEVSTDDEEKPANRKRRK